MKKCDTETSFSVVEVSRKNDSWYRAWDHFHVTYISARADRNFGKWISSSCIYFIMIHVYLLIPHQQKWRVFQDQVTFSSADALLLYPGTASHQSLYIFQFSCFALNTPTLVHTNNAHKYTHLGLSLVPPVLLQCSRITRVYAIMCMEQNSAERVRWDLK